MKALLRHRFSYVDLACITATVSVWKEHGVWWALALLVVATGVTTALEDRYAA